MSNSIGVISCFGASILVLLYLVTSKPYIKQKVGRYYLFIETYCWGVLIGPILLLLFKLSTITQMYNSLTSNWSSGGPLGILILFLSMALISIYLDAAGVIEYCARWSIKIAGNKGTRLFVAFYALVSVLTIFTSNDIIILTLTPFIYYFTKYAQIDPKPFLFAEFFAANTWSIMLQIGNPTNIYITSVYGINFLEYLKWMFFPGLIAGIVNFIVLYLLFRKSINKEIKAREYETSSIIKDEFAARFGIVALFLCLVMLAFSSLLNLEMWWIAFGIAMVIVLVQVFREVIKISKVSLLEILKRIPWGVIPFLLSFFIVVQALQMNGITQKIGEYIGSVSSSFSATAFIYGIGSTLAAGFMNNIPMSVLFSSIIASASGVHQLIAIFASVIGSNLGAIVTPIGALAGIMWMSILRDKKYKITFSEFSYYGIITAGLTLITALVVLIIEAMWLYH
jgi:arsenical pump membrane protein